MPKPDAIVKALGRWGKPTVERYRIYVAACAEYGIEPAPLMVIVGEVLNTPEDRRDWLLADEPIPESAPFVRFRQYETPKPSEQALGLAFHRKGKR